LLLHPRRLALWGLAAALWTVALLTTFPAHVSQEVLPPAAGFTAAKTLHVAAYAFLTATVPWLGLGRWRWGLLAFLSLHAGATEFLQQWVPLRTGSLTDVGIDHLGIALGLACTWRAWRR
jgi:VanZ family protein